MNHCLVSINVILIGLIRAFRLRRESGFKCGGFCQRYAVELDATSAYVTTTWDKAKIWNKYSYN